MKRFCPTKQSLRKRWKAERRLAKFNLGVKRCELRMAWVNERILSRQAAEREYQRKLEAWEREMAEARWVEAEAQLTGAQLDSTSVWCWPQQISCSTTVRIKW